MSADDVAVARRFLTALAAAAQSGELDEVFPFLAPDVEWTNALRDLHGVGEVRDWLGWYSPRTGLELDIEEKELLDLGSGRIATEFREVYRMKQTGELAYARDRRIELTIRDGMVSSYEMRFAG